MRERLIYILKHNMAVQKIYVVVMSTLFRLWGKFLKTDENLVIMSSLMGKSFGDSPKVLYDYMKAHPEYAKYHVVWAFEDPSKFPEVEAVKIDTPAYFKTAIKAKYWITNTNIERGLHFKKKDQIYLNTWHGIPLKLIGNDCPGRKDYDFRALDYLTVNSKYDEKVMHTAFRARRKSYLYCGMPRNDILWHATDADRLAMREKLGIPSDKRVILYAPTWRESVDGGKSYTIKPPIHFEKWREKLENEYVVLFRAHHLTTKVLGLTYDEFLRDMSEYPTVNDLLIAADLLITDYSAIAFDYSILCRPIFTYAYDYDEYVKERGTYFEMDERYPNKSCRTEEELLDRIVNMDEAAECENTKKFRSVFVQYGGHAAEECIEAVFGR